jgi:hypothetical protein
MANLTRNFNKGVMNKVVDERLIPDGQYINALNVRMGSTEMKSIGAIENTKGNLPLTTLVYIDGTPLSVDAKTIGAFEDGANETIYWFVHDSNFPVGATGKLDLIMSFNVLTNILTYHVISIDDGGGINTTLNFNEQYVITGVNKIDNLLFWTDDYNPPRFINVNSNYPNPSSGNIDYNVVPFGPQPDVFKERLQVIKRPPIESPDIQLLELPGQENFLENRFICFAYRYRYADNQYSAISQFTEPAFIPEAFDFSNSDYLNNGMVNSFNTVAVTYNAGGPLVVGVDLLFKEMESNVIRVIEKLDKSVLGLSDNTDYTYNFSNSKIYTILPESEILRLYDNVPLLAKAQTVMGNRLMYGNYLEGYDLIDKFGQPVRFEYSTILNSQPIGLSSITNTLSTGAYTIDGSVSVSNGVLDLDLAGIPLVQGSLITIDFALTHSTFSGSTPYPTQTNNSVNVSFTYYLPQDFASVFDMVSDPSFQDAIGTLTNVQPMANACNGTTLSDAFNCAMNQNLDTYIKYTSGINTANLLVSAVNTVGDIISFQFPAVAYVDNTTSPTYTAYEYMEISSAESFYQTISQNQSLHSNRDYEIGIVYMDDFNRSSTALVSQFNTVHVPCADSDNKNRIFIEIPSVPVPQIAPYWATRYKFVIKADKDTYETIYTNIFFVDPETGNVYFLLEGENTRKVNVGDRLIVKRDSSGPTDVCAYATVLEVASQAANFILIPSPSNPTVNIPIPGGVYMKIKPNDFSAVFNENSYISEGVISDVSLINNFAPTVGYPMNTEDPTNPGFYVDYDVPQGTIIKVKLKFKRGEEGDNNQNCEARIYTLEKNFVSQGNYTDMYQWFVTDNIGNALDDGTSWVGPDNNPVTNCPIQNVSSNVLLTGTLTYANGTYPPGFPTPTVCINYYQFYRNTLSNQLQLFMSGPPKCGLAQRTSSIEAEFQIYRADSLFIFETEPSDALPDVFFENELSFPINSAGEHQGNIMNQNFGTGSPAVIDTGFFNCYAFGNGAESYKILDSIKGNYILLGNRVTAVAAEDYEAVRRYADITYSGIYNNESNVNKLNEFNLGLLNYKQLERSFGAVYILDARQTDVLVLQEDKISYVLTEKNLLSDAGAGGALTSVPQVLGTQIARVEKYGISFNPESYIQWGEDRYFTDVKRGAVINLKDSETGMSQLQVISDAGMSTWFRDLFITDFDTQKLGAYDPYSKEYVLSSNETKIPTVIECLSCGITQEFVLSGNEKITEYCVNVGNLVGDVNIVYNVTSIDPLVDTFEVTADYNGTIYTTGPTPFDGTLTVNKDLIGVDVVNIQISSTGPVVLEVTVNCPTASELKVVEVVLTEAMDAGQSIVTQWRYTDGTYVGSLQNNLVTFNTGVNPIVSRYNIVTGLQGAANIPTDDSTVRMISNKVFPTNFDFDPAQNKFRYLRTNTLYNNNTVDINALVAASSVGTISGGGTYYFSDVPAGSSDDYLYLVWDLRKSYLVDLCWSKDPLDIEYVCCDCDPCSDPCREWSFQNVGLGEASVQYLECDGTPRTANIAEGQTQIICGLASFAPYVISGGVLITITQECGCRE